MKTLEEKLSELPRDRREAIEAETATLVAEELSLRELRKSLSLTQVNVAKEMGVGQDEVSRAENRADMLVSSLRNMISAMGGELNIVARMPGKRDVYITNFGDVIDD